MSSPSPAPGLASLSRRWPEHARADFYVGKQVDQFYLRKRIGQGGMACVFLAEDMTRRCEVAVKILSRLDMGSRFEHEITLLSTVEHPNLVPVLAAGTTAEDDPYLVEPFLAGVDLRDVLASGPLPWRVCLEIGAQVADALHALHVAGVIHRDVKPSNIMKVEGGPQPVWVRLIDLGHAKVTERWQPPALHVVVAPERHKTRTGVVLGSPGYIPPEAAQGVVDPRFDVFSLGVTLYQLCTGALPYTEGFERPRPIRETRPEVPQDLEDVILKAIAAEPAARWSSAELMRRALEAVRLAHPAERSLETLFAGSFDLLGTLGIGATGTVFRAHHRRLCRPAALKVLTKGVQADRDDRIRFDREAKILGLIHHPGVPRLFEYGIVGGEAYMAMELCKGKPIAEFCQLDRHLNPAQVISIGLQLVGALEAVHSVGVVYRDLSTSNVLVDFDEAVPVVRLIDFNHALVSDGFFARLDERYATPPELRKHPARELRLDKMEYSAPELRAGRPATPASDVYALAVLLYRALTGRRPFAPGATDPEPASKYCQGCPESLEEVLRRALNPTLEARLTLVQVRTYLRDACEELGGELELEKSGASVATPVTGEAPSGTAASPAASSARDANRSRNYGAAVLVAVLVAGLLGWLIGQAGGERTGSEGSMQVAREELAAAGVDEVASATASVPVPALPPMRVALDGAAAGLRRCAELAGGLLFVEFTVEAGRSEFSSVTAGSNSTEAIDRCVTEATRSIRFLPTASQVFTEEYTP